MVATRIPSTLPYFADTVNPTSTPSSTQIKSAASIVPRDAIRTAPPLLPHEKRQNNFPNCQDRINDAVNRATTDISQSLIELSATFSLQLGQASISASIATSSALSSLKIANKQAEDASAGLTNAQASAGSAISTLSASISVMQASMTSFQGSASAVMAVALSALASATGSGPLQASAILASAASAAQTPSRDQSPFLEAQTSSRRSLTPGQTAGIAIAAVIIIVLLNLVMYLLMRVLKRRRDHDNYLQEKRVPGMPRRMIHSQMSSMVRTGNGMTIRFNPSNSVYETDPSPAVPILQERFRFLPPLAVGRNSSQITLSETEGEGGRASRAVSVGSSSCREFDATDEETSARVAEGTAANVPLHLGFNNEGKNKEMGNTYTSAISTEGYQNVTASSDLPQGQGSVESASSSPTVWKSSKQRREANTDAFNDPPNTQSIKPQPAIDLPPRVPPKSPRRTFGQKDTIVEKLEANTNPFNDPINTQDIEIQSALDLPPKVPPKPSQATFRQKETVIGRVKQDNQRVNLFQDITPRYLSLPSPPTIEQNDDSLKPEVETQSRSSLEPLATSRPIQFTLEDILPSRATRSPRVDVMKMLNEEEEVRNNTVPKIGFLSQKVAEENGGREGGGKLFRTDFRASEPGVVEVPHFKEETPVLMAEGFTLVEDRQDDKLGLGDLHEVVSPIVSSPKSVLPYITTDSPAVMRQQEQARGLLELPWRSTIGESYQISSLSLSKELSTSFSATGESSPLHRKLSLPRPRSLDESGISPPRSDPSKSKSRPSSTMDNSPKAVKEPRIKSLTSPLKDIKAKEIPEEERGRNMSRISDTIHAKRSSNKPSEMAQIKIPIHQESNTQRNNPSPEKTRSQSLTPPSTPLNQSTMSKSRSLPSTSPTLPTTPSPNNDRDEHITRAQSNFRVQEERVEAESEVTIRARAGIYIPGSLREKAVKVSREARSRSRGRKG